MRGINVAVVTVIKAVIAVQSFFIQFEWYKPASSHLWNLVAAEICSTGQCSVVSSSNEQKLLAS